jgi:cell shape-determining protein MreC
VTITPIPIKGISIKWTNRICTISTSSFQYIINNANNRYGKVKEFALSLYEINTTLAELKDTKAELNTILPPE